MSNEILTTSEAAKLLGISVRTAQLLIEGGALNAWKTPGGHRRVYRSDVLAMMAHTNPAPAVVSALVILLATPTRRPGLEAVLATVGECKVDSYADTHTAAFAIGSRLPAIVIIDLDDDTPERISFLQHLAANPTLGQTALIATGDAAPAHAVELARMPRVLVKDRNTLPEAIRAALRDPRTPAEVMEGNPTFPIAANEGQRLVAMERTGLLDTLPEESFDRLTWLASRSLHAPVALLTLLSAQRQWFKSRIGLEMTETPRDWAFCNHTILQKGVFTVGDLTQKPPFAFNPAVAGDPHFRFYAGAPLTDADGFAVGTLCVIDYKPRTLDAGDEQTLLALAALASDEIRLRATDRQLRWALEALNRRH